MDLPSLNTAIAWLQGSVEPDPRDESGQALLETLLRLKQDEYLGGLLNFEIERSLAHIKGEGGVESSEVS